MTSGKQQQHPAPSGGGEDQHEEARHLGEEALEALDKGDEKQADALIEQAKKLDKTALTELVQDLEEGAGSTPPE
jgi:phage shock protein A